MYIFGMREPGIHIKNPLSTFMYVPTEHKEFEYSKWLIKLKEKLTNKWYKRTLLKNRFICWFGAIMVGIVIFVLWIWGAWELYKIGMNISQLGFAVGLGIIAAGLWTYWGLSDKFPTDSFMLNINNRKL